MKTDQPLLKRIASGETPEQWSCVIEVYGPMIKRWLVSGGVAATDVDDISQEVLCTLIEELPRFEHNGRTGAFRNWLRSITVNRTMRHWGRLNQIRNRQTNLSESALYQLSDPSSEMSKKWDDNFDRELLDELLRCLSVEFDERTFTVFRRTAVAGEPVKSIASEYGITAAQVYKYRFRVMRRLREEIKKYQELTGDQTFSVF
ncbi:RNA polymerase sigma factor [Roseiconus lacunae]|uniref:RNA polymerase sigma factor n=1 Tax=Roseiconus lacunae TaxID=2605694 RepID=UPI001E28CEF4|nr:sigma-70 family RNA polymerase sigma factor [Roseiconus lacunae]MCD0457863.1 sigma-70 family RNA polymerase sigma factor [Roseiconus lacunae]